MDTVEDDPISIALVLAEQNPEIASMLEQLEGGLEANMDIIAEVVKELPECA